MQAAPHTGCQLHFARLVQWLLPGGSDWIGLRSTASAAMLKHAASKVGLHLQSKTYL